MANVAATFRLACARLKAASTAIQLSSYFTDTTLARNTVLRLESIHLLWAASRLLHEDSREWLSHR